MKRTVWISLGILATSSLFAQSNVYTFDVLGTVASYSPANPMGYVPGDAVEFSIAVSSNGPLNFFPNDTAIHPDAIDVTGFAVAPGGSNPVFGQASGAALRIEEGDGWDRIGSGHFASVSSTTEAAGYEVYEMSFVLMTWTDFPFVGTSVEVTDLFNPDNWLLPDGTLGGGAVEFTNSSGDLSGVSYVINDVALTGVNVIPEPSAMIAFVAFAVAASQIVRRRRR